jgi:transglutaminase-like putative cysteine protease
MIYRVRHVTTYAYADVVSVCHNQLHLRPRNCIHQLCTFHELVLLPEPAVVSHSADFFGNPVTFFTLQEPHRRLSMTANSTVEVTSVDLPPPPRPHRHGKASAMACGVTGVPPVWKPINSFLTPHTSPRVLH